MIEKKQDSENLEEYIISKSKKVLNEEFEDTVLIINGNNKEKILKELDLLNINEATLFPELEHQLNYIKNINGEKVQSVNEFVKYERDNQIDNKKQMDINVLDEKSYMELNEIIISIIQSQLQTLVSNEESKDIIEDIEKEFVIDWYKKDSAKSKLKMSLIRNFQKLDKIKKPTRKNIADEIMQEINEEIENYVEKLGRGQ